MRVPSDTDEKVAVVVPDDPTVQAGVLLAAEMRKALTTLVKNTQDKEKALAARGDEVLLSMYRADPTSPVVVVFDRRYGAQQGLRTVVLAPIPGSDLFTVAANAFAPQQRSSSRGTGTVDVGQLKTEPAPTELHGVAVRRSSIGLLSGWYVEFTHRGAKLACGPFSDLTALETWLDRRHQETDSTDRHLRSGERIFHS